jgi:galactosamine-6-phosphate isomerase
MFAPLILSDHEDLSRFAKDQLVQQLRAKPDSIFCLAAGTTPQRTYELFREHYVLEPDLFARLRIIKLDEWGGLAPDDEASCEQFLRRLLIDPLRMHDRYVGFMGRPADGAAECSRIAGWLERHGPIDTCVLGLGMNGHLGFNEPAPALQAHAHVAQLSSASLSHSMLARAKDRPTFGLTLGMADLLHSRHALLLVSGESKRTPLGKLLEGAISTEFPASLLALHLSATLVCDRAAHESPE